MKRILVIMMCVLFVSQNTVCAKEIEEPNHLYAQAAVLMDAESGRILFEKNGTNVLPMASTTKIMTCIITLEMANLEDVVAVSDYAASQPKVHLGMKSGEQFKLRDLLYSLMLESHNDSAVAIAEHVGKTVEGFAVLMNEKAREIGCSNTYFITPNGLDSTDEKGSHSTTAEELAMIMSYCIMKSPKKEEFINITSKANHSFHNVDSNRNYSCTNKNSFLTMMSGAISGKTGFTGKAGYCYVGALKRDGRYFVVSLLACGWPNNKNYKWKDTLKLMEYAVENYTYRDIKNQIDLPMPEVERSIADYGQLHTNKSITLKVDAQEHDWNILLREDEHVDVKIEIKEKLKAPIKQNETVGKISLYLKHKKIREFPIVAAESVEEKRMSWYLKKIAYMYFVGKTNKVVRNIS